MAKDPKRVSAGRRSRLKGKVFERKIASLFRERFPFIAPLVRRSIQSRQAEESDVTGVPGLWIECQHAADPTPIKKLQQAIRDSCTNKSIDFPIAITHKTNTKDTIVTIRIIDFFRLAGGVPIFPFNSDIGNMAVTVDIEVFFSILEQSVTWRDRCTMSIEEQQST